MNPQALMDNALTLSERGLGRTWPNPSVGCVICAPDRKMEDYKTGDNQKHHIIARGRTGDGGRPHAEKQALARAAKNARGADVYVTLEPCSHSGKDSCTAALIRAGVKKVTIAIKDPDPRNHGKGIAALRHAGITVQEGVCAERANIIHAGFIRRVRDRRPLVTWKTAASLDGRIAPPPTAHTTPHTMGRRYAISGPMSHRLAHFLRRRHDGVAVGIETVIADNPRLTPRIDPAIIPPIAPPIIPKVDPPMDQYRESHRDTHLNRAPDSPMPMPDDPKKPHARIVFDSHLRIKDDTALLRTAPASLWIVCRRDANAKRRASLEKKGCRIIAAKTDGHHVCLVDALRHLGTAGLTRLLVEGGGILAGALLRRQLVDHCVWFSAPFFLGHAAKAAIDDPLYDTPLDDGAFGANQPIRIDVSHRYPCGHDEMVMGRVVYPD